MEEDKPDIKPIINDIPKEPDDKKNNLCAALKILKKYNLNTTAETLKKEANLSDSVYNTSELDVNNVLNVYKSQGDPLVYENAYITLSKFVETSLDIYKHELGCVLYPVFVHMYLDLVCNGHQAEAVQFMKKFGPGQESYYQNDIRNLAIITKKEELSDNILVSNYKSNEFVVRMSRDTLSLLKRHLKEKKQTVLLDIVQENLFFDVYEGIARNKQQIDSVAGGMIGEGTRQDNKSRVYYGLMKEPDLQTAAATVNLDEDEEESQEGEKPKKKKSKSNPLLSKKTKIDPNAPPLDRMALPQLREVNIFNSIYYLFTLKELSVFSTILTYSTTRV